MSHLLLLFLQDSADTNAAVQTFMGLMAILPLLILIGFAVVIVPFWFICKKAGFSPWLSLLNIVPFGFLILIYVLAFSNWRTQPQQAAYPSPYPPQPAYPQPPYGQPGYGQPNYAQPPYGQQQHTYPPQQYPQIPPRS